MSDPEVKGNGVAARFPGLPLSGRAARRSLERVSGPDPKGSGAASGRGMNVARPRYTYVAFPQQLDGRNRPDVNFSSPPSGAMSALNLDTDPAPAPPGNVSRQGGNDGVPHRTLGCGLSRLFGRPPKRHAASPRHAKPGTPPCGDRPVTELGLLTVLGPVLELSARRSAMPYGYPHERDPP